VKETDSSRDSRRIWVTTVGCEVSMRSVRPLTALASRSHIPRFASCRKTINTAAPANTPSSSATRIAGSSQDRFRAGCEETVAICGLDDHRAKKGGGQSSPPPINSTFRKIPGYAALILKPSGSLPRTRRHHTWKLGTLMVTMNSLRSFPCGHCKGRTPCQEWGVR
jgi:hypothetical protein